MRRFWPAVFLLAGAALVLNGLQYLALLAGSIGPGRVEYSLPNSGARYDSWDIHYVFRAGPGEIKGSATGAGSMARGAPLEVRYLKFWPAINHPGSGGMLVLYGLLSSLPGAIFLYFAQRSLRRRPGARPHHKGVHPDES